MVPDSFVPTSLPMCVPVAPAACGGRSILRDIPSSQHTEGNPSSTFAVVTHNLFSIPRVYRQLAETASDRHSAMLQALSRGNSLTAKKAATTDDTTGTISSSSHIVFPLSSSSSTPAVPPPAKIKAYVGALTRAWSCARDADIPSVSYLLNGSQPNYISPLTSTDNSMGSSQLTNGEFTANPFSHQAAVFWGSGGELAGSGPALVSSSFASTGGLGGLGSTSSVFGDVAQNNTNNSGGAGGTNSSTNQQYKAPTARDPLLILEWVSALNAVINGVGCGVDEAFDPEKLWPLREFSSVENSGGQRGNAHFFSASEARSARNFSKSALDRAKKRAALAQKSYAHFSSSEALRGPALLTLLLEILAAGGGAGIGGGGELYEAARWHPAGSSAMSPNATNTAANSSSNQLRSASFLSTASVLASPTNTIPSVNFEEASAGPTTYYANILTAASRSSLVSATAALLPPVLSSCEEAEKAVIEAALACLYNFIHPVASVVAHKVPMTAKLPNPASSSTTASPRRGTNRGAEAMPSTTSTADYSDRKDGGGAILLCQTHVAARAAPFEWNEVRSEIGKLRNGPQPPLVDLHEALVGFRGEGEREVGGDNQAQKPSPYLALPFTAGGVLPAMTTASPFCGSPPFVLRTVLVDAFYVKRERSLAAVQKLTKLNVYRPLFTLLARHASQLQQQSHAAGGASGEGESTGDNPNIHQPKGPAHATNSNSTSSTPLDLDPSKLSPSAKLIAFSSSARIVYLCSLLISALGGATKQCEAYAAADGMLKTLHGCGVPSASLVSGAGGGAALEGGAGANGGADSEGDDDGGGGGGADGDDEDDGGEKKKKKGNKKKSSKKKKKDSDFNGGCSSGPMRLASVTGLAKTGTLARLGGASAALVAALEMALNALKITNDNTASEFEEVDVLALSSFPSSSSALSPLNYTSAVLSAIATVAVGSPNISFLYKKSIIPLVSEAIDLTLRCCRRQMVRTNARTCTGTFSSPLFAVLRWSIELLYRLLGPTPAKPGGGMMSIQLSAEELSCVKDVFMREFEGLGMLIACAELGAFCLRNVKEGRGEGEDPALHYLAARSIDDHQNRDEDEEAADTGNKGVASFPSPPLFCAACDVLQVLLSVPSIAQTLAKSAAAVSGSLSGDSSSNVGGAGGGGGGEASDHYYYFAAVQQRGLASLVNAVALGAAADSTVTNAVLKHIMSAASLPLLSPSLSNSEAGDTDSTLTKLLSTRSVRAPLGAVLVGPLLRAAIRRSVRLSANAWSTVINHVMRVLDVKELPVGTDNELAWFPPPELVEELKRQQQAAAETTAAAKADINNDNSATDNSANPQEEGRGDDPTAVGAGDDSDDDDEEAEEEDDALGEDVSTVAGLADLSPELHLCSSSSSRSATTTTDPKRPNTAASTSADAAAPKIPSHTSILGIASVHHIKPFSSPRPLPSSSSVLNASPPHVEPLLVQPEFVRSEAIKGQLTRLVYAASTYPTSTGNTNNINTSPTTKRSDSGIVINHCCQVVYDDLTRSTTLPKTRIPLLVAGPQAQQQLQEAKSAVATTDASHMSTIAWLRQPLSWDKGPLSFPTAPVPQNAAHALSPRSAPPEIPLLSFDSAFESGNLKRAIHVMGATEYDLILHADVNTNSFVQWFYFAVGNITPGVAYRFNILNMEKETSTFNDGQRPLLFSERRYEASGKTIGWTREGYTIAYYKNSLVRRARERYVPKELMDLSNAAAGGAKGTKGGASNAAASANGGAQDANGGGGVTKTASGRAATSVSGGRAVSSSTNNTKRRSDSASTTASSSSAVGGAKGSKKTSSTVGGGAVGSKKSGGSSPPSSAAAGEASQNTFYTLSFTIVFPPYAKDRVYLANCYPYTYSDLIGYCRRLLTGHEESCAHYMLHKNNHGRAAGVPSRPPNTIAPYSLFVQSLCPTLSGNATPLLTITNLLASSSSRRALHKSSATGGEGGELTYCTTEEIHKRPVVLLTARVHPGESNASYMIKGCIDFLLSPTNAVAHQLREQFVFKIIPMLNPDGVINGNHRCGLAGTDLNRGYHKPSRWKNPTIFYLKALAHHVKRVEGRALLLYADFHGHSRCHNGVIYGCGEGNSIQSLFAGIAPSNLQSSLTLANALLQSGGGDGAKASEVKSLISTTSAGNAEWPFTCTTRSQTVESSDVNHIAATHGYSPQLASSAACIIQQYRARVSAIANNNSPSAVAAAKKLNKNADFIAESFGFSKASNPHPFTLQSYANTTLNYGTPERLLPLLLGFFCPYFSYRSSTFTIQKGKRNTGRVVFYRQLGVRMSYTVEASMMGGVGLDFFTSATVAHQDSSSTAASSSSSSPDADTAASTLIARGVGCCDDYPAKAPSFADPYAAATYMTSDTKQSQAYNNDHTNSALPEHESLLRYVCARRPDLAAVASPLPSLEQTRRMAAQWSIQNNQLSASAHTGINLGSPTHAPNNDNSAVSVDGNEFISHCLALSNASSAGHFAPKHYTTIGMMMLKSLYHMWGASRSHRGGLAYMNDAYRSTPPPASPSLLTSAGDDISRSIALTVGTAEDPYYRLCEPEVRAAVEDTLLPRYRAVVMGASVCENSHFCTGVSTAPQPALSSSSWPSFNEIMATHVVDPAAAAQLCGIPPSVGTALGVLSRDIAEEEALAAISEKRPKKKKKKGRKSKKASNKGEEGKKKKTKKVSNAAGKLTIGAGSASTKKRAGVSGVKAGAQNERLGTAVSSTRAEAAAAKLKPNSAASNTATSGARPGAQAVSTLNGPAVSKGVTTSVTTKPSPAAGLTRAKRGVRVLGAEVPSPSPSQLAPATASVPTRSARANLAGASASTSGPRAALLVLPSVSTAARPMTTTTTSPSSLSPSSTAVKQKRSAACTPPLSPQALPVALITSAKPSTFRSSDQPPTPPPPPPRPPYLSIPSAPQALHSSCAFTSSVCGHSVASRGTRGDATTCSTHSMHPPSTDSNKAAASSSSSAFSGSYAASTRKGSQVPSATTAVATSASKTKESLCGCVTQDGTCSMHSAIMCNNSTSDTNATNCASSSAKCNVGIHSDNEDDFGDNGGGEHTADEGDEDDDAHDGEEDDDDDDLEGNDDDDDDEDDDPNGGDEEGAEDEECEDEDGDNNDNAECEEDEEIDGDGISMGEDNDDPSDHHGGQERVGEPTTRSLSKGEAARDLGPDHSSNGNDNAVEGGGGGLHLLTRMGGFASFASLMLKRRLPIRGGVPVGGVAPMPAGGRNTSASLSPGQQRAKARRILRHAPQADIVTFCHQAYLQGPVLL